MSGWLIARAMELNLGDQLTLVGVRQEQQCTVVTLAARTSGSGHRMVLIEAEVSRIWLEAPPPAPRPSQAPGRSQ